MKSISIKISQIALFTSLSVVGRMWLVFIPNVSPVAPLTLVAGYLGGALVGGAVGLFSMIISDMFIGIGPWTLFTSIFMGLVGLIGGLLKRINETSKVSLFLFAYIAVLLYDVGTSVSTMSIFGVSPWISLINLFLPVFILGIPYPMGPIHEFSSSMLFLFAVEMLNKFNLKEVVKVGG